ncbi:hypothetical protein LPN04_10815 [Rugamonas sp. A1-17]|nr:hypothetical protein [Rugamonas sp. A1-17]
MITRLSHMKWALQRSEENPAWAFDVEDTVAPGIKSWTADFDALMLPLIKRLRSNEELATVMQETIHYKKPTWVRSDGLGFISFKELLAALQR